VVLIFCLYKAIILIFIVAVVVIKPGSASADVRAKDSEHEDVHADEQLPTNGSTSARDPCVENETAPTHKITVCDVALVSCRTGAIDHDAVYDLLIECLQDVSFVPLMLYLLRACY
jgi:hypothetical protein